MRCYRLVTAAHLKDAFTGEGARRYGGRWNPVGYPVVYTSQSRALGMLETLVHLTLEAQSMQFFMFEITLPRLASTKQLAPTKRASMPGQGTLRMRASQDVGRKWLQEGSTLALQVPSVIVPCEFNHVLNVQHPLFCRLRISEPVPVSFDSRLWQWSS